MTTIRKLPFVRGALTVLLLFTAASLLLLVLSASIDAKYRETVLHSARFKPVLTIEALPSDVRAVCFPHMRVANPKEYWSIGCGPKSPDSPSARLAWAVTDGELWLVEWERGGIYYDWDVALFSKKFGAKAEVVWGRTMNQSGSTHPRQKIPFQTFEEFKNSLRQTAS
jgi:hypothetical protein